MTIQNFKVTGQHIERLNYPNLVSGSRNQIEFAFDFSAEWAGINKTAVITTGAISYKAIIEQDGRILPCNMPVLMPGFAVISVYGGDLYTADVVEIMVEACGLQDGVTPTPPPPDIYNQILDKAVVAATKAGSAEQLAMDTQGAAATAATQAAASATAAVIKTAEAAASATAAKTSELNADTSEAQAIASAAKATQAMTDLLAMLGSDIATLVGGKIPMGQIPATATQEIYTVSSEAELVGLTAQRGDLAELIEMVGGVRTITKTWQLLGNSTIAADWVVWGTAYAVSAGNAATAANADNAAMINNHRLVEMAQAAFEAAAKDPATYYLVN